MIGLEKISKSFDGVNVLKNVTVNFNSGETTVLIGPSGCGKSALIRIICGLILPDTGYVFVENKKIDYNNLSKLRKNIGYVIQDGGLFPHLTIYNNIIIASEFFKIDKIIISERISFLLNLTKLDESQLSKYPSQLSGGQKQRVSLIRSLMLDPKILLLDEPLGALDPLIRYDLQNDLKEIFTKLNKTVIMVTHDLSEAVFFGDNIVLLNDGRIVQKGKPIDLIENPKNNFVEKFVAAQRSIIGK